MDDRLPEISKDLNLDTQSTITAPLIDTSVPEVVAAPPPVSNTPLQYNGIFDFMTPERAIELYKQIHSSGIPDLEWKFYGRRKPGEQEKEENKGIVEQESNEQEAIYSLDENSIVNNEFDFGDEDFGDLQTDTSLVNDSFQLKKRESGTEKKTNLSDIMSNIMKEN